MKQDVIRFPKERDADFMKTLKKRVSAYFKENNKNKHGDHRMIIKTFAIVGIFLIPYAIMISGSVTQPWAFMLLWIIMGVGTAGIGLGVMHDANHGAFSDKPKINKLAGYLLNLVGGNAANWRIQHNILHHSYTNIDGYDEDISRANVLRLSPHKDRWNIHAYQHYYAWFLYGLMTFVWVLHKDFVQLFQYKRQGLTKSQGNFGYLLTELIISKLLYFAYVLVLPIILLPVSPWLIVGGFLTMHFVAGFILSCIFQLAHVMPSSEYPIPDENNYVENNWAIHQLLTTTNFAQSSYWLTWYVGGLNYQVEHHLFPNICHVHYTDLSKIVRETAEEFGIPYYSHKTFLDALRQHTRMLKYLGNNDGEPSALEPMKASA